MACAVNSCEQQTSRLSSGEQKREERAAAAAAEPGRGASEEMEAEAECVHPRVTSEVIYSQAWVRGTLQKI